MIRLWISARAVGVSLSLGTLIGMWLRKSPVRVIAESMINAHVTGVSWPIEVLEVHALAGGDPAAVVRAAIVLRKAKVAFDREALFAAELRGLPVADLAAAYIEKRERWPQLEFGEILERATLGEDVKNALKTGTFMPRSEASGWRARLEYGPLTAAELTTLLGSRSFPTASTVWDPQSQEWNGISEATRRLRGNHE